MTSDEHDTPYNAALTEQNKLKETPSTNQKDNEAKQEEEDDYKAEDEFETSKKELKKNLLFEQKTISVWRLYCHLSDSLDIFLMILGIIGSVGAGCAGPLMAFLTGDTVSSMSSKSEGSMDNIPSELKAIINAEFEKIISKLVTKFLCIGVGMFAAFFLMKGMWFYVALRQMQNLKEKYFAIILCQEQGWFDSNNAFEFATKVQAQLEQIELGVGERFGQILQMIAQLLSGLVIAFTSSWKLTLVMLAVGPLIVIDMIVLTTALKQGLILSRKTYEKAGGIAEEMLYNIKTVASFANFQYETNRFNKYIDQVNSLDKLTGLKLGACIGFIILFINSAFVVALVYARVLILKKEWNSNTNDYFKSGDVMTVMFATLMAIMSIGNIGPNIKIIQESCIASSDYFTLVDRVPKLDLTNSKLKPDRDQVKGRIEFKGIDFVYPSDVNHRKILDELSLVFEPGQKVALVGESGCGKSTTVNLIERLYDPIKGDVFIDGINIKQYDVPYLRSLIGYVQQEPVLFNKSIRENLIFGREEVMKTMGNIDQLLEEACEEAYASEFIHKNPEKFDYTVGIKGSKLSGGQKQRIAIARAILCKPKILILDEATSALDNKSEKEVQRALDRISSKKVTTVIIAHRLSTIKNADVIFAIKEGKVYEKGTHQELLAKNGYYAGLVKSQLAQDELESKEENMLPMMKKKTSSLERMTSEKVSSQIEAIDQLNQIENQKKVPLSRMRLLKLLKNNKLDLCLATLGSAIEGGLSPINGLLMAKAINALSSPDKDVIKNKGLLYAMLFLVLAIGNGCFVFLKIWKFQSIGSEITTIMRKKIIDKYLNLHVGYFDKTENSPGALLTQLSIDTTQLNSLVLELLGDIVHVAFNVIVGVVLALVFDWRIALIGVCFIPFMGISYALQNKAHRGGRDDDKKMNIEAGSILSECVVNTKTIYSFNFQSPAVRMYIAILEEARAKFTKDSFFSGFLQGLGTFANYCLSATVFKVSSVFIIDETLSFENMMLAMSIMMTTAQGIGFGLQNVGNFSKAAKSFKSLFATIDTESLIDVTEEGNANKITAKDIKGQIEFKNVSFSYPTRKDQKILKNVNFTIQPGQAAALVGYSGCGKSTIIQLLERYYDPDEGEILIDGVNIKDYNLLELRKKIGLVSQEPVLFKRSVYQNILYGKLSASKEEVFNAAERACIIKFFTKTDSGTKEDPVSGGEKQRLAIGRAFLKNPRILLLDEATSALDKESEKEVQKSIYELQKERTSIAVAHRLSTIEKSDVIFVLEAGRIVERGTHQELMNLQGKYYILHKYSDNP